MACTIREHGMTVMMATHADLQTCLNEVAEALGICELKPEQKEAILAFADGRGVFVSLPTGYGKSICYGCLPGLFSRLKSLGKIDDKSVRGPIAVVISSLVAIMRDQTREFTKHGVSSIYITGPMKYDEEKVLQGQFRFVYISPEQLLCCRKWREMLISEIYQEMMIGFIVDEAHSEEMVRTHKPPFTCFYALNIHFISYLNI